jgi:hypothetical protein
MADYMYLHLFWPRERLLDGVRALFAEDARPEVRDLETEELEEGTIAIPFPWTVEASYRDFSDDLVPFGYRMERTAHDTERLIAPLKRFSFVAEPLLERDEDLIWMTSIDRTGARLVGDHHVRIPLHFVPSLGDSYAFLTMEPGTSSKNSAAYSATVRRWAQEVVARSGGLFVLYEAEATGYIALLGDDNRHLREWDADSDAFWDAFMEATPPRYDPHGYGDPRLSPDAFAAEVLDFLKGSS